MTDPTRLIEHLLNTEFSIDRVDSIVKQLNTSRNQLLQLINDEQYRDYFQILRPSNDHKHGVEKIALTLDVCQHSPSRKSILLFSFSSSIVHIMLIIVGITRVHSYIFVLTMFDQCMQNVRIRLVRMIMISIKVNIIERLLMHMVLNIYQHKFYIK